MKTLVEAPPLRKSINWYRVGAWALLVVFVCFLVYAAIFAWPHTWDSTLPAPTLFGSTILGGIAETIGVFVLMGIFMSLCWVGIWLLSRAIIGLFLFGEWWYNKMQEADKKNNLTYED